MPSMSHPISVSTIGRRLHDAGPHAIRQHAIRQQHHINITQRLTQQAGNRSSLMSSLAFVLVVVMCHKSRRPGIIPITNSAGTVWEYSSCMKANDIHSHYFCICSLINVSHISWNSSSFIVPGKAYHSSQQHCNPTLPSGSDYYNCYITTMLYTHEVQTCIHLCLTGLLTT